MSSTAAAHDFFQKLNVYALWLMPSAYDALLQDIVHTFVPSRQNRMWFESHMTAQALARYDSSEKIIEIVDERQIFETAKSLKTEIMGIATSELYTQALFLPVRPSCSLMDLSIKIRESFAVNDGPFMPHVSAAYGAFSLEQRSDMMRRLAAKLEFPLTVTFDRATLVHAKGFPNEWREVHSWPLG